MNAYIVTFIFICFDYVTGLYKALMTHSFSSKIMRQGLGHKIGLVLAMCAGWLVDFAQRYMDIGYSVPVAAGVCVYIVLMELVSALENIRQGNPDLLPEAISGLFANSKLPGKQEGSHEES